MIRIDEEQQQQQEKVMDQLSVQVNHQEECESSEDEMTSEDEEESSLESTTPVKSTQCGGLLAYSTPMLPIMPVTPHFLPKQTAYENTQSSFIRRKPRVNFHSIDDIVNSSSSDENDSGISSSFDSANISNQHGDKENEMKTATTNDKKGARTTFTDHQKQMLDVYFQKNPYPDPKETEELSQQLVLPENVIKVWFQNKRSRDKQRKFSNRNKAAMQLKVKQELMQQQQQHLNSSPLLANLHLLSKFNQFQQQQQQSNNFLALYTKSLLN